MLRIRDLLLKRIATSGALLPAIIQTHTAEWEIPHIITLAGNADSFYEYLLKVSWQRENVQAIARSPFKNI